jgi:L-threonylcarbamoyladenylate synthase
MKDQQTQILAPSAQGISAAIDLLGRGDLVSFPTETVYGLGADARNSVAVAKIFEAKGRPRFNPLIVHVASAQDARIYVEWSEQAQALSEAFWPGPLTLVLPLRAGHAISPLVTADLPTLAIRVPSNRTARALLAGSAGPVAAPSANPSGRISPTTAAHVLAGLNGKIAAILDDGPCSVGVESTIIGLGDAPIMLREGGASRERVEQVLGMELLDAPTGGPLTAPGQMQSHYAPNARVRLNATTARPGERMLGFGAITGDLNLSETGDLAQAAARLFDYLHQMDVSDQPISVAPIPDTGLGRAINDRLARAAAPR